MSDSKKKNQEWRPNIEESLKRMTGDLQLFSLAMRSLYSDKNPGTSPDIFKKFTKLRDDTREDAKVYLKVILPLTIRFVSAIKDFYEFYDALSYDEWRDSLPDILENTKANKDFAQTLLAMYEEIIVPLKKREDEAKVITKEFNESKWSWTFIFAYIPILNWFLPKSNANEDPARKIAKTQNKEIDEVAFEIETALTNFIKGLTDAAGFFEFTENELNSFEKKGKEVKALHYKIMRSQVQKINLTCHEFYTALPAIRTDFEAIPDGDAQQNYVKKWLEEKRWLKEIEKKRESTQKLFWDVVEGIQGISSRPIRAPVEKSSSKQA